MARLNKKQLEKLKKKHKVNKIWSFSKVSKFKNCSYSYFLRYIKGIAELEDGIYAILGGNFHDILEDFYDGKIKKEDVVDDWELFKFNVQMAELKFNKSDEDFNEKIAEKYYSCLDHYAKNFEPIDGKVATEKVVVIKVGKFLFVGYIDAVHYEKDIDIYNLKGKELLFTPDSSYKKDGKYYITDFKTSTIYTGKKILKEGVQLLLYSYGLNQAGIPLENIVARWDFMKYLSVTFQQANGKYKTMNCARNVWVAKMMNQIRRDMKKKTDLSDEDIELMLAESVDENSIDNLPKEIQDLYEITNCYVEVPINQEEIDMLIKELEELILDISQKTAEYEKSGDESIWYRKVEKEDSYFCSNLCGYTANECPCYAEFLDNLEMKKADKQDEFTSKDSDTSWMEELGLK